MRSLGGREFLRCDARVKFGVTVVKGVARSIPEAAPAEGQAPERAPLAAA